MIAAGEVDHSERTASVRRVPGRKVGNDQLQVRTRISCPSYVPSRIFGLRSATLKYAGSDLDCIGGVVHTHCAALSAFAKFPSSEFFVVSFQSMFRSNAESAAHQRPQSTHSTFSNKKPLRVLPPTVSATNAFQYGESTELDWTRPGDLYALTKMCKFCPRKKMFSGFLVHRVENADVRVFVPLLSFNRIL